MQNIFSAALQKKKRRREIKAQFSDYILALELIVKDCVLGNTKHSFSTSFKDFVCS